MATLGKLLRRVRAGEQRGPLAGSAFTAPVTIAVTSAAFADGGAMPQSSAGKVSVPTPRPRCAGPECRPRPGSSFSSWTTSTFRCRGRYTTPSR